MQDSIEEFIRRRFNIDCNWKNGNCYWFAHILITRFQELSIYYLPIEGHFVAGNGKEFYDYSGKIDLEEDPILFSDLKLEDDLLYDRIVEDCIL